MKFGMMYEIQIPEPHYPGIEQDTYKQVIAQVVLAEEMGFEYFWTVEHHFLTEFSYCPAPESLIRRNFSADEQDSYWPRRSAPAGSL